MAVFGLTRRAAILLTPSRALTPLPTGHNTVPSFALISRRFDHALAPKKIQHHESHGSESDATSDSPENTQPAFSTLRTKLNPDTLRAITDKPFNHAHMSSVQAAVLPLLPELARPYDEHQPHDSPRDLLVKAKTGTGKTLAFLVPAIEARIKAIGKAGDDALEENDGHPDARVIENAKRAYARKTVGTVVISPTRELATQIAHEAVKLTHWHKGFEVKLFTGGSSRGLQLRDFKLSRNDIVVATPGRIRDVLENEPAVAEVLKTATHLVLDEADTLLNMGFRPDIDAIVDFFPRTPIRQTFLFSATVSPAIRQVAREVLDSDHLFIDVASKDSSPVHAHIPQFYTVLPSAKEQLPHLFRIIILDQLANPGNSKIMVFLNTTKQTELFATVLRELSKTILPSRPQIYEIHSKRTQSSRSWTSNAFRNDRSGAAILVTSDVSARGIDYPDVTRVIQVGSPLSTEQYVHRVGRTGRAGKTGGRVDLLLLPFEQNFVRYQLSDIPIKELSHNDLLNETASLSEKFESDPAAYWNSVKTAKPSGRDSATRNHPSRYNKTVIPLSNLDNETSALFEQIDKDAIREVFVSLLSYYFSKAGDMRVTKERIYEGIQAWTTEACGLPEPLFVSDGLLAKMGGRERGSRGSQRGPLRKSFGLKPPGTRYNNSEQNRWQNERTDRGASRSRQPWGEGEHKSAGFGSRSRQPWGEDEHKSARFGSKFSDWGSRGRTPRSGREGERQRDGEWRTPSGSRRGRDDDDPF